jgi:tetratricopeptide (TPR) repeat protein
MIGTFWAVSLLLIAATCCGFVFHRGVHTPLARVEHCRATETAFDGDGKNRMYDDLSEDEIAGEGDGIRYFREYAKRGLKRFLEGNLDGAVSDLNRAATADPKQPLQQRGIVLYIVGQFEEAARQLEVDIKKMEHMKLYKASELRLWCSACYNKLGQRESAISILDMDNRIGIPCDTQSAANNRTLGFFASQIPLEELLEAIGSVDERDTFGARYYGNFYLGLFYDSVGEPGLAQAFLTIPNESTRYPPRDMWYQVPRMLYRQRFTDAEAEAEAGAGAGAEAEAESGGGDSVNSAGMIL